MQICIVKKITSSIPKYKWYLEELQPVMIHVTVYSRAKIKSELNTMSSRGSTNVNGIAICGM